jgi:hypothetical protein
MRVAEVKMAQVQVTKLQMAEAAHEREQAQHQANAKADEIPVLRTQ